MPGPQAPTPGGDSRGSRPPGPLASYPRRGEERLRGTRPAGRGRGARRAAPDVAPGQLSPRRGGSGGVAARPLIATVERGGEAAPREGTWALVGADGSAGICGCPGLRRGGCPPQSSVPRSRGGRGGAQVARSWWGRPAGTLRGRRVPPGSASQGWLSRVGAQAGERGTAPAPEPESWANLMRKHRKFCFSFASLSRC